MHRKYTIFFIVLFLSSILSCNNTAYNQAYDYIQANHLEQALGLYQQIHTTYPNNWQTPYNIAYVYNLMGNHAHAITWYNKALQLEPYNGKAHLGLAKAYLSLGDLEKGLPEFEWRIADHETYIKKFKHSKLRPRDLKGKQVLIRAEWGLGDMVQFIRYTKLLKESGAFVMVEAHEPLQPLFELCPYIDRVYKPGIQHGHIDIQIPCLSLPLLFNTTVATIPAPIPYLQADPQLVYEWQQKLADDTSFKVGLCWHAKPIYLEEHTYTRRSIPLALFAPLATIPGVTFYSLQKVDGLDGLATLPSHFVVHDLGSDFDESHGRFMDTAAVIKNLDLIISADTAIVHIAGALGKPVWVLLPYTAEWRWLQERTDTPWYPHNMRLFRQQEPGNWQSVIARVTTELKQLVMTQAKDYTALFKEAADHIKEYDYLSAIACYKKILAVHPTQINTLKNLAHIVRYQGIMDQAVYYYKQALQYSDDADLHYGLAESQLALGNFKEGWHHFEWRYKRGKDTRHFDHNIWNGTTDLSHKTILVRAEYGLGDTIQFIRYLPLLKAQGATVIFEAQPSLIPLLSLCPYIDQVIPICSSGIPHVAYDIQIPLMSLPERCKTEYETDIPSTIPYLFAQEQLIHYWKEQIKNDHNFKIGICWNPSPYYETFKSLLSRKSVPLELFAQLAELPHTSLYSLQKMNGLEQLQNLPNKTIIHTFSDFDTTHGRFMDTAALITQLDLIITVDTSIAHLAGALGKPVWVLLPYVADWRWMTNRTDSPWYPTMKLFRQHHPGSWQPVMDHVLQTFASCHSDVL